MLTLKDSVRFVSRKSIRSIAYLALLILPLISLAGCADDGGGGPMVSSVSAPADASADLDSDQAPHSEATDSDGEEDPMITMTPTPAGVIAHVTWVHPPGMSVAGYDIHYRKQPAAEPSSAESGSEEPVSEETASGEFDSEEQSSCSSGESQTVEAPAATITGLEPNTRYVFAIRAFNESESLCSNEIAVMTPSTQS